MRINQLIGKGNRETNQDFICVKQLKSGATLCMIADGMGGYEKGNEAAKIVAEKIYLNLSDSKNLNKKIIQKAVQKADLAIRQFNTINNIKSGATIGGVIIENEIAHIFWVGDVMVYHIKNGNIYFQTKTHSLKNSLFEYDALENVGSLDKYNHIVTRSLSGKSVELIIGYTSCHFFEDDICIICSDGFYNTISINEFLSLEDDRKLLTLIEKQLEKDAQDNFSLIHIKK